MTVVTQFEQQPQVLSLEYRRLSGGLRNQQHQQGRLHLHSKHVR